MAYHRLSSFVLQMLLASVTTGVLILVGGAFLEEASVDDDDPQPSCTAFQVGSPPRRQHPRPRSE